MFTSRQINLHGFGALYLLPCRPLFIEFAGPGGAEEMPTAADDGGQTAARERGSGAGGGEIGELPGEARQEILFQMNSQNLCHREMEVALSGAQKTMDESLQFCTQLRRMQMKLLTLYPCGLRDPLFTVMPGTCADQYIDATC